MTTPEPEEILDELLDNVWRSNGGNPDPVLKAKIVAALAAHTKAAVIEELENLLEPRDCLRPECKIQHTRLNRLHVNAIIAQLKGGTG